MREWLQLFRAQTAPATVYSILVPYLLAGGRDWIVVLTVMILGTFLHYFTFGHNSLMDYWYDREDPNKQHHPLVKGVIPIDSAHKVIHYGLALTSIVFIVLTIIISPKPVYTLSFLLAYIVFGHAYNDGLDKNTSHSWISITLCFTALAGYGWFLGTGRIDLEFYLILVWAFLTIFYQIAWEGNLKDVFNPAEKLNLLRNLGVSVEDESTSLNYGYTEEGKIYMEEKTDWVKLSIPNWLNVFMYSVRTILNTVVLILLLYVNYSSGLVFLFAVGIFELLTGAETIFVTRIHRIVSRKFQRDELLEYFGLAEATEFFRLISVYMAQGIGQFLVGVFLIIYGLEYFIVMNKLLWKSKFGPRV